MGKIWVDGVERDETPEEEADRLAACEAPIEDSSEAAQGE